MLSLEWPWLLLMLPLPWLVYRLWPPAAREEAALRVPFFGQLPSATESHSNGAARRWGRVLWLALIWSALLLAVSRPTWLGDPVTLPASGRDLLLAVDISGSMETPDMTWQGEQFARLTAVKSVVGDFVERRSSDRLGLILFGTRAYLQAPLTFDRATVNTLLQEAQPGFAGEKTAIGDAIGLAVKRLQQRPQQGRVLILLTDGANTAGQVAPLKAAELAARAGVKIYTVGIGADEMVVPGLLGGLGARRVNPSADLDEDTLRGIAEQSGGQYFRARDPRDLLAIYARLDELEPTEQEAETFRPTRALFHWPLGLALLLTLSQMLLHLLPTVGQRRDDDRQADTGGQSRA